MSRRALLLAIADYDQLPPLPYVRHDIPRLQSALPRAGYAPGAIEAAGAGVDATELTRTRLRSRIRNFFKAAGPEDDLLLFLSGHGIEFDGRRVLLPQDYDGDEPENPAEQVWDGWIATQARGSAARSVLVLIDACREGAQLALAPAKAPAATDDRPLLAEFARGVAAPTIGFLYSCAAGEQSGADFPDAQCSAFTRAVAEALEAEQGPAELGQLAAVIAGLLQSYSEGAQTLTPSGQDGRGGPWARLVVREDEAARFRQRLDRSEWAGALVATPLFAGVAESLPGFALQLRAIAMRAEENVAEARRTLPMQHWRDDVAWRRLAVRLQHVFLPTGTALPAEAAVLLAVPLVYETVLATAETRLAATMPDPDVAAVPGHMARSWRAAWRDSNAAGLRQSLLARFKADTAADHACWTLAEFCHSSGELWDARGGSQNASGWALDAVDALLAPAPFPEVAGDRRVCAILAPARLLLLARLMFASFDDVTLDSEGGGKLLKPQVSVGEFGRQVTINEIRLAHLLNFGARLALDARRMPSVLAEHIGLEEAPSSAWLCTQLAAAEWHEQLGADGRGRRRFDLSLECRSNAVDAAMLAVVDGLESSRTRLLQRQDQHADAMRDLLPAGFTAARLNAEPSGLAPTRPPLRFELDRPRIIRLLMGQQLYGEKWPALRELYQNALDACRYRRAKHALALLDGVASGPPYQGRIEIRFGEAGGRRYVECADDGIGMAERHVRRLFAYAGQRFTDSHEFHIDRARWDEAGIPFFNNSRFGIGVLSYFMLAEELELMSRRYADDGVGASPVQARVIGTGSLFRLESAIEAKRLLGPFGTVVRLYLRYDAPGNNDLIESILGWLAIPEVATAVRAGERVIDLPAGKPAAALIGRAGGVALPLPNSAGSTGAPRVYLMPTSKIDVFAPERTEVFIDGILTRLQRDGQLDWPTRTAVNLSEDLLAIPSVDRRSVKPDQATASRVWAMVREGGAAALLSWPEPEFVDLHRTLDSLGPAVTLSFAAAVKGQHYACRLPGIGLVWDFGQAGMTELDSAIVLDLIVANPVAYDAAKGDQLDRLHELSPRQSRWGPIHPLTDAAIMGRAAALMRSGFELPPTVRRAVRAADVSGEMVVPVVCRTVLDTIEAEDRIGLAPLLNWIAMDQKEVLAAAEVIREWDGSVFAANPAQCAALDPTARFVGSLARDGHLTVVDVAYAAQSRDVPFAEMLAVAATLTEFGIVLPHLRVGEPHPVLPAEHLALLDGYSPQRRKSGLRLSHDFRVGLAPYREHPTWIPVFSGQLPQQQLILLSRNLDGKQPFARQVDLQQILRCRSDPRVGAAVREAAKGLAELGLQVPRLDGVSDAMLDASAAILARAPLFTHRLFSAIGVHPTLSRWDFALALAMPSIDRQDLAAILDLAEACGTDVDIQRALMG